LMGCVGLVLDLSLGSGGGAGAAAHERRNGRSLRRSDSSEPPVDGESLLDMCNHQQTRYY
jgi:hypothetical protein